MVEQIEKEDSDIFTIPVLYIDDEKTNTDAFLMLFKNEFTVFTSDSAERGLKIMDKKDIGLVITDERMPGMSGIEFLENVVQRWPDTIRIIISAHNDTDRLYRAINKGHAHEYILKPWDTKKLKRTVVNSLIMVQNRRLLHSKAMVSDVLQEELKEKRNTSEIIGKDTGLKDIITTVERVAPTDVPVLIQGETGTGKEVIAQLIHETSNQSTFPFIKVNCAAINEGVLESELFGHEKGAFTSAHKTHIGKFELAGKGTILLDEIGDISPKLQLTLLRILQEKEFERVGGTQTIKANVRIIAATNQDLERLVDEGKFRQDLYFRINVVPIYIPPLRERKQDIEHMFLHFIQKYQRKYKLKQLPINENVFQHLKKYYWPGNVRELENTVQRVLVTTTKNRITLDSFSFDLRAKNKPAIITDNKTIKTDKAAKQQSAKDRLKKLEDEDIRKAYFKKGGNCKQAAISLGMPRSTFRFKAKRLGLL